MLSTLLENAAKHEKEKKKKAQILDISLRHANLPQVQRGTETSAGAHIFNVSQLPRCQLYTRRAMKIYKAPIKCD